VERSSFIEHYNKVCLFDCKLGCGVKTTIDEQDKHYETCSNFTLQCTLCWGTVKRHFIDSHDFYCPEKDISCTFCKKEMKRKSLSTHYDQCKAYPILCACQKTFERKNFNAHNQQCPEVIIMCLGSTIGCEITLKRSQMTKHEKECVYAKLSPIIQGLRREIDDLKKENHFS